MAEAPGLTLKVDKGPRKGESIECKSNRVIRIGRVVKGNTFAIKDRAISEKHISIQFLPNHSWSLTDLDTSNGTFLNDRQLDALVPTTLRHGDVIKIGSQTSIRVHAVEEEENVEAPEIGKRRRGRSRKVEFAKEEEIIPVPETGRKVELAKEEEIIPVPETGRKTRRGRTRKVDFVEEDSVTTNVRRTRGAARREALKMESFQGDKGEEEKGREVVSDTVLSSGPVAVEEERKCGDRSDAEEAPAGEERDTCLEAKEVPDVDPTGDGNESVVATGEEEIEMEKMTLGQWFDRLEKCLPTMINDAAEEIIAEIRANADRYNEYIRGK